MADTKISDLTATTTVADTDDYVVASSGTSKKITGANLKAGVLAGVDAPTQAAFNDHSARHEDGGADEISIAGLAGTSADLAAHLADATDAHDASAVSFSPVGTVSATDVQAAIAEVASEAGGGIPATLVDAKGDLIAGTANDTVGRLAVGSNNQVLVADSGQTTGVKWSAVPSGGYVAVDTIWDSKGDLAVATAADTASKLAVGSNGQVLTADSAQTTGVKWAAAGGGGVTVDSYVTVTSNVSITGSGGTPTTVVTAGAITADGSTVYKIECFCYDCSLAAAVTFMGGYIYDSSTKVFQNLTLSNNHATVSNEFPVYVVNYITPSAASHTYSWRCGKSGGAVTMAADTGTGGLAMPIYIRISHGG